MENPQEPNPPTQIHPPFDGALKSNRAPACLDAISVWAAMVILGCTVGTSSLAQVAPLASGPQPSPAPSGDAWGIPTPSWLQASSLTVTEGYDSNIYGVSDNLAGHPPIANISSWFTELNAGLTLDLLAGSAPESRGFLKTFTLAYSADYTAYEAAAREDNMRNSVILDATAQEGPWSFSIDNPFLYVDGSKEDEFFNYYNNLGYAVVRERRNQIQERNVSFVRYDGSDWFVRAVDSLTYYNLLIDEHNPVGAYKGYANWVNRDDMNTGLDFGLDIVPNFALVAGWRLGQQTQAHTYYNLAASDSTYNRALFGFEGTPFKWLTASFLAGPDFRRYSDADHLGLTGDHHTWLFLKGQLTAKFTPADTLTASERVWHFVSSAGVYSIQETAEGLNYQHIFSPQLSASAGLKYLQHRYDAPTVRNDVATTVPVDVTYAITRGISISADYSATTGRSRYPVAVTPDQNFEDNLISLSLKASF